jgi:repressor LexA
MHPEDDLTDRQRAILDFVRERIAMDGLPPTWAEIAHAFGFRQTRAAQKHLQAIAAKGHLELLPGKARGIRLPEGHVRRRGTGTAAGATDALRRPVLGRVAAGAPIGADAPLDDDALRHLVLDRALFATRPDYLLRVSGDSMRDDGILDGDLVAIQRTANARTGQTVVARLDDEVTIKRLQLDTGTGRIRLLPRNPAHAPIEVRPGQDFAIEGVFCGLLRGD